MPSTTALEVPEYQTIFSQCFSPDGQFLAVGDERGRIVVYNVLALISREDHHAQGDVGHVATHVSFSISDSDKNVLPVLTLATSRTHLLVGSLGEVSGWAWEDILKKRAEKQWRAEIPLLPGIPSLPEVNWIEVDESIGTAGQCIVASGDSSLRFYDLETGELLKTLKGHEKYIHCVSLCQETGLLSSGGEDGIVALWDRRKKNPLISTLKPYKKPELSRPTLGKWVGAVKLVPEWVVCGGGPRSSLWHLRTMTPSEPLPVHDDRGIHAINVKGDRIFLGGAVNKVYQASFNGELLAEIPVSSSCIYSLAIKPVSKESEVNMLTCAGSSSKIDICSPNLSYKDKTIIFSPKC